MSSSSSVCFRNHLLTGRQGVRVQRDGLITMESNGNSIMMLSQLPYRVSEAKTLRKTLSGTSEQKLLWFNIILYIRKYVFYRVTNDNPIYNVLPFALFMHFCLVLINNQNRFSNGVPLCIMFQNFSFRLEKFKITLYHKSFFSFLPSNSEEYFVAIGMLWINYFINNTPLNNPII